MGFLENFLKKLGPKLATRYGVVSSGKYAGCSFAMGNPPKAAVTTAYSFSQIIFIKNDEEVARFNIVDDVIEIQYSETIQFSRTGKDGFRCKLTFENGDSCDVDLFPNQVKVLYNNLKFIMPKETFEFFQKEIEKLPQA